MKQKSIKKEGGFKSVMKNVQEQIARDREAQKDHFCSSFSVKKSDGKNKPSSGRFKNNTDVARDVYGSGNITVED
jgi:hypothetical protein